MAQPITSPNDVLSIVEAGKDEQRFDISADENPFRHLNEPLKGRRGPDRPSLLGHHLGSNILIASRDASGSSSIVTTYLQSQPDLFSFFNKWVEMPLPSDATRRVGMQDPVRVMNQLAPTRAELGQVVLGLTALRRLSEPKASTVQLHDLRPSSHRSRTWNWWPGSSWSDQKACLVSSKRLSRLTKRCGWEVRHLEVQET